MKKLYYIVQKGTNKKFFDYSGQTVKELFTKEEGEVKLNSEFSRYSEYKLSDDHELVLVSDYKQRLHKIKPNKNIEPNMFLEDVGGAWHGDETQFICPVCDVKVEITERNVELAYGFTVICYNCSSKYKVLLKKVV